MITFTLVKRPRAVGAALPVGAVGAIKAESWRDYAGRAAGARCRRGGLLASGHATAQDEAPADAPTTTVDSALLVYHEVNRVQAIEPEVNVNHKIDEDSTLLFGITADSLTGPTPLGAVPSTLPQTYVRPYKVIPLGTPVTVTTASGGSTVVLVPPPTGAKTQTLAATTIVPRIPIRSITDFMIGASRDIWGGSRRSRRILR